MGAPIRTTSYMPKINGKNLRMHNTFCCEDKRPVLCARRFHKYNDSSVMSQNWIALVVRRCTTTLKPLTSLQWLPLGRKKGKYYAEELGDDDIEAEESGDKESAVEKSGEQMEDSDLATKPEARLFEGYNMHWMAKTPGKYNMKMVYEFYANYYYTLEKKSPTKNAIKKEPVLDFVRVRAILVDIYEPTITRVLMGGDYIFPTRTTEYDH
ncbi:hypothetical protein HAX54_049013 [Datura stramonium]|uniref:Uncharacterized protein n=1 Tax=Datura stramonium TaxID=4076 RepID=A0ABS8WK08_DATST|nr:hypothetical protein [Datura stramonium]